MKKLLAILMALVLTFTLAACTSEGVAYTENEDPTSIDCFVEWDGEVLVLENVLEEIEYQNNATYTIIDADGVQYVYTVAVKSYCKYNPNQTSNAVVY